MLTVVNCGNSSRVHQVKGFVDLMLVVIAVQHSFCNTESRLEKLGGGIRFGYLNSSSV